MSVVCQWVHGFKLACGCKLRVASVGDIINHHVSKIIQMDTCARRRPASTLLVARVMYVTHVDDRTSQQYHLENPRIRPGYQYPLPIADACSRRKQWPLFLVVAEPQKSDKYKNRTTNPAIAPAGGACAAVILILNKITPIRCQSQQCCEMGDALFGNCTRLGQILNLMASQQASCRSLGDKSGCVERASLAGFFFNPTDTRKNIQVTIDTRWPINLVVLSTHEAPGGGTHLANPLRPSVELATTWWSNIACINYCIWAKRRQGQLYGGWIRVGL